MFRAFLVFLLSLSVLIVISAASGPACSPAANAQVAVATSDGLMSSCKDLVNQPEPAWVYFTCEVVDIAGNVIAAFVTKVPAANASAFRARNLEYKPISSSMVLPELRPNPVPACVRNWIATGDAGG